MEVAWSKMVCRMTQQGYGAGQELANGETHVIDILVVYPAAVRSEAGSTADVEAAIATAVADTNLCIGRVLCPCS